MEIQRTEKIMSQILNRLQDSEECSHTLKRTGLHNSHQLTNTHALKLSSSTMEDTNPASKVKMLL